jgi:hypothetical protein
MQPAAVADGGGNSSNGLRIAALTTAALLVALLAGFAILRARRHPVTHATRHRGTRRRDRH